MSRPIRFLLRAAAACWRGANCGRRVPRSRAPKGGILHCARRGSQGWQGWLACWVPSDLPHLPQLPRASPCSSRHRDRGVSTKRLLLLLLVLKLEAAVGCGRWTADMQERRTPPPPPFLSVPRPCMSSTRGAPYTRASAVRSMYFFRSVNQSGGEEAVGDVLSTGYYLPYLPLGITCTPYGVRSTYRAVRGGPFSAARRPPLDLGSSEARAPRCCLAVRARGCTAAPATASGNAASCWEILAAGLDWGPPQLAALAQAAPWTEGVSCLGHLRKPTWLGAIRGRGRGTRAGARAAIACRPGMRAGMTVERAGGLRAMELHAVIGGARWERR